MSFLFQTFLIDGKNKRYAMIKIGNFEIEYDKNAPDAVTVKIETDKNGEVWLPKCDIARAYGVFVQSVNAGLKSLAKTGDFDEYRDVRVEHFTYNGKDCSVDLYSLATIIALGFRMKGLKCEAFRKWAARRLAESFEKKKSTVILCMSGEKRNSWN